MSITIMKMAWEAEIPPPEKLILLSLSDQANDEGVTWPSVSAIVKKTGMSERTVFRHLASLEKLGHIKREQRVGSSTVYHVHPCQNGTPVKMAPLSLVTPTPAIMTPTPATGDTLPLSPVTPTPATVGRQKHQEPSLKPKETKVEPSVSADEGFAEFWIAYPKKTGKQAALKAWAKLKNRDNVLRACLEALAWQRTSKQWTRDGGQYVPNPATYLNEGRWDDQQQELTPGAAAGFSEVGQRTVNNLQGWLTEMGAK
jgi:DNA-binding transcriptional ArsR family regulator